MIGETGPFPPAQPKDRGTGRFRREEKSGTEASRYRFWFVETCEFLTLGISRELADTIDRIPLTLAQELVDEGLVVYGIGTVAATLSAWSVGTTLCYNVCVPETLLQTKLYLLRLRPQLVHPWSIRRCSEPLTLWSYERLEF